MIKYTEKDCGLLGLLGLRPLYAARRRGLSRGTRATAPIMAEQMTAIRRHERINIHGILLRLPEDAEGGAALAKATATMAATPLLTLTVRKMEGSVIKIIAY